MKAQCLTPTRAWACGAIRSKADGVLSQHLVFNEKEAREWFMMCGKDWKMEMARAEVRLPCGRCVACKIRQRKEISTRLYHETLAHGDEKCCFLTLTYDEENVPTTDLERLDGFAKKQVDRGVGSLPLQTLLVADVQKFMKRLRRHLEYQPKSAKKREGRDHVTTPIRYFVCGEYGAKFRRPHYHLIIFGWKPSDLRPWMTKGNHMIYRSAQVEKLWKFGFSTVAPVQGGVAAYCAKYVTKKFSRLNDDWIWKDSVFPEFSLQSVRHGGIGAPWYDDNFEQMMSQGFATIRLGGNYIKQAIPRYYWRRTRQKHLCLWLQLRDEKIRFIETHGHEIDGYDELLRKCLCHEHKERSLRQTELF